MQHITKRCVYSLEVELLNCDGTPMDLSTCTVKYILKKDRSKADSDALLSFTYENPDTNCLLFEFDSTQTSGLPDGSAVCGIKVYRTGNLDQEVWTDECIIEDGVFLTT